MAHLNLLIKNLFYNFCPTLLAVFNNIFHPSQDQYVFVHDALLTYIKIGSTHVSIKDLLRYYNISSPPLTSASVKQQQQHNNISINNSAAASASTLQQQYKFDQIIEKQFNVSS